MFRADFEARGDALENRGPDEFKGPTPLRDDFIMYRRILDAFIVTPARVLVNRYKYATRYIHGNSGVDRARNG